MFNIWNETGGTQCDTVDDANAVIRTMFNTHPGQTVCCELLGDDNESLSYWEFTDTTNGLIPDGAQP